MTGELPMRPRSIVNFERLYLLAIGIEAARVALDWPLLTQSSASEAWVRVASIVVSLLLVLLTSRRRKRAAGIVLAALFAIGLPMVATALQPDVALSSAATVLIQVALQAIALVLLFLPASRAWFATPPAPDTASPSS